jgi:putative addiction module killer protein
MMIMEYEIELYKTKSGKIPYDEWLESLDDYTSGKIFIRIERLSLGNFSNCEPIGEGAHEVKMDIGPGYRIYFSNITTKKIILILNGGTKRTQPKDIKKAKEYLEDYKIRGKNAKK